MPPQVSQRAGCPAAAMRRGLLLVSDVSDGTRLDVLKGPRWRSLGEFASRRWQQRPAFADAYQSVPVPGWYISRARYTIRAPAPIGKHRRTPVAAAIDDSRILLANAIAAP